MAELNGRALSAIAVGSLFVWSGIKGWSMLGTVRDIIAGIRPSDVEVNPLSGDGLSGRRGGSGTFDGLASTALQYVGHAYQFGGAPGKDGSKPWDCSSFVNWLVGVKLGKAIPGYGAGKYDGSSHGPPTGEWGVWPGLKRISRAEVMAGDIIVWVGHMGIATDNGNMVSALNPKTGTKVTPIDGHGNGPLIRYGRLL